MTDQELRIIALNVRNDVVTMIERAGSGHVGGSLSCVDILVSLYFDDEGLRLAPDDAYLPIDPYWPGRDRFILSVGHYAPALYSVLARRRFEEGIEVHDLKDFRTLDSRRWFSLPGHPRYACVPGVENTSGSLGQGLSIAVGVAHKLKTEGSDARVYCLMGDGEQQEGQVWEAVMHAFELGLNNLTAIIDYNRIQSDGAVIEVTGSVTYSQRVVRMYQAAGWAVRRDTGHMFSALRTSWHWAREQEGLPVETPQLVFLDTIAARGLSGYEGRMDTHGLKPPFDKGAK